MTKEEYIEVKKAAYILAANLSERNIGIEEYESIVNYEKSKYVDKDVSAIFEYTVKYPNDIDLIREIEENPKESKNISYLAKKLNWPFSVVTFKKMEIAKYDLANLINEDQELSRKAGRVSLSSYADQASFYEINGIKK